MTSLAAGPPLLLSELGQYLIESLSIRAEGGGWGALEHSIYRHQLGKQLTLLSAHYDLVLAKRVLSIAQVPERSSSSLLTRKKRNISRQPASMLRLFCQAQSFKNITRSFEHGPVLSQALY